MRRREKQLFLGPLALAAALQCCLSPVLPIPPARAVLVSPAAQGGEAIPPEVMEWLEAMPSAWPHFRAQSLINLGLWNGALGRHPEALSALSQAEAILRPLASRSAEARRDLAKALNNRGKSLNVLARRAAGRAAGPGHGPDRSGPEPLRPWGVP